MEIFKKNRVLINQMVTDSFKFLQGTYNQGTQLFTFASAWGQILLVVQNISQLMLYFIEDSITELNIYEASRRTSIYNWARLSGHNPTRAMSAKGMVEIYWNGQDLSSGGGSVIIPNYTKIVCNNNGLYYSLKLNSDQIKLQLISSGKKKIPIIQGSIFQQTFGADGKALKSFNYTSRSGMFIDNFDVDVYVNDEKWKKYESLYDMSYGTKGYLLKSGISNGLDIYFGTGSMGLIPSAGSTVKVNAIINDGFSGTVLSSEPTKVSFKFVDSGFDLFGNEINLNDYLNINTVIIPSFGTDPEPVELTRIIAPRTSKNYVFATPERYTMYLEKFNAFSIIQSYTTFDDDNLDDDNIIYIVLVPDVKKTIKSNEDYFSIPEERFLLNENQKSAILTLIHDSGSMIGNTLVQIIDPILKKYIINIRVSSFEGYDRDILTDKIRTSISNYFIGIRRNDKVPKSDLISIMENIPGVDSCYLEFVSADNEKLQKDYLSKLASSGITSVTGTTPIGLDSFGDIILKRGEIALIRGGWEDRNNNYYEKGVIDDRLCSLNINYIGQPVSMSYNTDHNNMLKDNIKKLN